MRPFNMAQLAVSGGNLHFLEEMARSNDKLISEVVESTVMEELHDYLSDDKFKPYLGNESKVSLSAVSGYMEKIDS